MNPAYIIYSIAALTAAGVIIRPFKLPEYVWALTGASLLLLFGLISWRSSWEGIYKGTDVYLFLTGMMLLAETAREEGLFDWLAGHALRFAGGSPFKLFLLVYIAGLIVTTFMSNDATAVVMTPAVAAVMQTAKVKNPLPYLLICAFIANAASFILPISNPANLVIYGSQMPPLSAWLKSFLLPSVCSVIITFLALYLSQRKELQQDVAENVPAKSLSFGGKITLAGIAATTIILLIASAKGWALGLPTAIAGIVTAAAISACVRRSPVKLISNISWGVLPLVAGLFVIVEALNQTGLAAKIGEVLANGTPAWISGSVIAVACNLVNNLPAGLIAGSAVAANHLPLIVKNAVLISVDLGPNLSVTGSLATILWLTELRRNGRSVGAWQFLKIGVLVMFPALLAALFALWIY